MVWAPRNDERSSRKLDTDLKLKISGRGSMATRRLLLERLRPTELLHEMSPPVYNGTKEKIIQKETHYGRRNAVGLFLDEVTAYNGWALALLDALHNTGFNDIAQRLCSEYSPPPDEGPSGGGAGSGPGGGPRNSDDLRNSDNGNYRNHDSDNTSKRKPPDNSNIPIRVEPTFPLDPPPPYDEAVRPGKDVTVPKKVDIELSVEDILHRPDNNQKIALEKFNRNRSERRNTYDNSHILVTNDKDLQEDGHSSRSRDDPYVVNERAVVVDCARIQPTPQNNNQNRSPTLTEQIASNSSTQQNSTSTPTLTSSQASTNDSAKSTMTDFQSQLSSDSSSSNSEPDSFDLARKGPANDLSPDTILNIEQSDCYNSSDTTSDNNFTQQFPQGSRSSEESDIPKKAPFDDETKKNSIYLHSVDHLRYDPSSECNGDEKTYVSLVTKDMKFSHDSTNVPDKLEKPIEIIDEGEVLISDAIPDLSTMKEEGNSTDFINFDSREVVQPPTPGSQAPIASARELPVLSVGSTVERPQSDNITMAATIVENLSINEDDQPASQTEESLNHQASSMADGDHSENQTRRANIRNDSDRIDETTGQTQQSETITSEQAQVSSDTDAEKVINEDENVSNGESDDPPTFLHSLLNTGGVILRAIDRYSRYTQ